MLSILGGKQGVDSPSKTPKTTILHFDLRGFLGGPLLVVLFISTLRGNMRTVYETRSIYRVSYESTK